MLRVSDIMQSDVISVAPELTLRQLLEVLTDRKVGGAPVVAHGEVIGVVSATDLLRFQEETPGVPVARPGLVNDPGWAASQAEEDATNSPSEFFSQMWEPAEVDALERMRTSDSPEWDLLDEHTVTDVMTRAVVSQPPTASVKQAAGYMLNAGVHRVLVLDGNELLGIVTATDIVRAVSEGKLKG